jgi:hypothetical protein
MDCETYRERIGADPLDLDRECDEHERSCVTCAAYAARVRASERLIHEALRFDVERARKPAVSHAEPVRAASTPRWAIAASVVAAGMALWVGSRFVPSDDPAELAAAVEDHWSHEPESWVRTSTPVAGSVLEAALGDGVGVDVERLNVVSYARSCLVNGRWVPHLVVQGEAGPVMVLLLADEQVSEEIPLDIPEEGLRGVIVPVDVGSIAILGDDAELLETIEQDVSDAVSWSI